MFGNELQEEYEESVFIYILLIIETPKSSSFSLENKFIYNNEKKKEISYQRQSNLQDEAQLSVPYKVSSLLLPRKKKLVFFSLHDFDFAQGSYRARTWEEIKERRKDALGRNI